jgi:hypothetical protein
MVRPVQRRSQKGGRMDTSLLQNLFNFWACCGIIYYYVFNKVLLNCPHFLADGGFFTARYSLFGPVTIQSLFEFCIKQATAILMYNEFGNKLVVNKKWPRSVRNVTG